MPFLRSYGSSLTRYIPGKKFNGITMLSIEQFFLCAIYRNLCIERIVKKIENT